MTKRDRPMTKKQIDERLAILAFVVTNGGSAVWSQLHGRGFHYMTVQSMALAGLLRTTLSYTYSLTEAGREFFRREPVHDQD